MRKHRSGSFSPDASLEEIRSSFKVVFDSIKEEGDSIDYMFETVRREIRELTNKKIGKVTVKNFYYGGGNSKFSTVMLIKSKISDR